MGPLMEAFFNGLIVGMVLGVMMASRIWYVELKKRGRL